MAMMSGITAAWRGARRRRAVARSICFESQGAQHDCTVCFVGRGKVHEDAGKDRVSNNAREPTSFSVVNCTRLKLLYRDSAQFRSDSF